MDDREQNLTIEKKIDKIVKDNQPWVNHESVENWEWRGPKNLTDITISLGVKGGKSEDIDKLFQDIKKTIEEADITECLTSKSEYIREYKKWLIKNE